VAAFNPQIGEFIHIEISGDSLSWKTREERMKRKFGDASKYYKELFPFTKCKTP